jgi:simple sugar transport system permease protein
MPAILKENFYICTAIVLLLSALVFIYMRSTKHGYELAVVGESEMTARYAGINVKKVIIRTMLMSGAICGLCGFLTVSGIDFTISSTMNSGYGFTAIVVAWLAKFNPFTMIGTSFMMVFFENAATEISSMNSNATVYLSNVISGIILFFLIGCEFFIQYRLVPRKKGLPEKEVSD